MSKPVRCLLTARDFSTLEMLLEREGRHDETFLRLLRRKLSTATVVFQDDIAPEVATIDSRIEFTRDRSVREDGILVHAPENALPGRALPVTTLRGLALLGLTAGESIVIEEPDGSYEELQLDRVSRQPAPERSTQARQPAPAAAAVAGSSVVAFVARRKPARSRDVAPVDPDDDDPGPRAA